VQLPLLPLASIVHRILTILVFVCINPLSLCSTLKKSKRDFSLFFCFQYFVFCKNRGNGLSGYGTPDKDREPPAVPDVRYLETDDQAKTEAGNPDQ
jgi:hypothetical protein